VTDLDRTLKMKLPALVVRSQPRRSVEVATAPYHRKTDLVRAVSRQTQRGEVRPLTPYPVWSAERGRWEHRVVRLKDAPPAWRRPAGITAAVVSGAGTVLALGWWVLATLAAAPLLGFLAAVGVALLVLARAGRRPSVTVTTTTEVRVR
jgi:hypothetical protein